MVRSPKIKRVWIFLTQPLAKKILWLLLFTWLITALGYCLDLQNSGNKIVAALFLSWAGDVLFFSGVGALLAIISSFPAALQPYNERVSVLFQGGEGSQIDYAKSVVARLGNYSERTEISISVEDDEDDSDWFRLTSVSKMTIRNLVEDVETIYPFRVTDPEQFSNPPGKIGNVNSFLVDGVPHFANETKKPSDQEFSVQIGGDKAKDFTITRQYWIKDGGEEAHTPARFTKILSVFLINRSRQAVFVRLIEPTAKTLELEPFQKAPILLFSSLKDIAPLSRAYRYFISRDGSVRKNSIRASSARRRNKKTTHV